MKTISVPLGIGAPNLLLVTYDDGLGGFPLLAVTGVSLAVTRTDGTTASWACTLLGASPTELQFQHAFASGDCLVKGRYRCAPTFTVAGGSVPGNAFALYVQAPGDLSPYGYEL